MRPFRFPRSTIFLMLLILASTVFAIEQGRQISRLYPVDSHFEIAWSDVFRIGAGLAAILWSIGALGYLVLFALRQSGAQRFPNIRTWAERR